MTNLFVLSQPRPKTTSTTVPQDEEAMILTSKAVESCVAQWFSAERLHREVENRNAISAERDACELSLSELEMKILRARASKQDSLEQLTTELTQLKLRRGPRLTAEIPDAEIRTLENAIERTKADMNALKEQLDSGDVLDEQDQLERQAIVDRLDALKAEEEFKSKGERYLSHFKCHLKAWIRSRPFARNLTGVHDSRRSRRRPISLRPSMWPTRSTGGS